MDLDFCVRNAIPPEIR